MPRLALALALLAAATPAAAQEGGGARSVFAAGAGSRPLSMGSAFAAVADDASALTWNVAGLARVPRFEVQAGQADYFGFDLDESYVAIAAPSWRWGTASMAWRRFGAGGIERRDHRNAVLETGLDWAESELALGYARSLGDAVSLGAALKARQQSLAGAAASGFGMDLGVLAQPFLLLPARPAWAPSLSWGLALTNLIEPSLRLDHESVPDPRAVRSGVAWRHGLGGVRSLVVAVDVAGARGAGLALHAGAEMQVTPAFAVRAGLDGGGMTAGTGFRWRDLALDYGYEAHEVEDVHRFGLTYGFGATVTASRDRARRAEEARLQERLGEAFQRRQAEQIQALLQSAERLRLEGAWDEALDAVATVHALEPDHPEARLLEARCLVEKAAAREAAGDLADAAALFGRARALVPADSLAAQGERRCREESDRRAARTAELRRRFAGAIEAFGADRLAEARAGFRGVLAAEPGDREAAAMLERTELAIERRLQSLVSQGHRFLRSGLLGEVERLAAQAEALDPGAAALAPLQAALAKARREAEEAAGRPEVRDPGRAAAAPAERPAPGPRQRKELELLYRKGLEAIHRRRTDDALRYLELVRSADPGYADVSELLKREYLTRGMESFAAGQLDQAVGLWEKALEIDPKDPRAIGYLARAQKQLARTREILGGGR